MTTHIIIINGAGGSGKDTFVDFCQSHHNATHNLSMINYIKQAAKALGWDGGKADADRQFLSDLRQLSESYNDHTFKSITTWIDRRIEEGLGWDELIFIHCREPHNIARLKNHFRHNCSTLLIERHDHETPNCDADQMVRGFNYDEVVHNAGTLADLHEMAREFVVRTRIRSPTSLLDFLESAPWPMFIKDLQEDFKKVNEVKGDIQP